MLRSSSISIRKQICSLAAVATVMTAAVLFQQSEAFAPHAYPPSSQFSSFQHDQKKLLSPEGEVERLLLTHQHHNLKINRDLFLTNRPVSHQSSFENTPMNSRGDIKIPLRPVESMSSKKSQRNKSTSNKKARMVRLHLESGLHKSKNANDDENDHGSDDGSSALLTADEEIECSHKIRTYRAAVQLRDRLVTYQSDLYVHPTESGWANACGCTVRDLRRLLQEGQDARLQLISSNAGLVVQIAKRQHAKLRAAMAAGGGVGTILTVSDMVQEGTLGLMEAAERFDPAKGFRFSTYATYWVRQRIMKAISDSSRVIRLPAHVHGFLQKVRRARRTLKDHGHEPTTAELARHLQVSEATLKLYTSASRNVVSLENSRMTMAGGGGSKRSRPDGNNAVITIGDTLASDAPTPEEAYVRSNMQHDVRAALEMALTTLERQVIRFRFGLHSGSNDNNSSMSVAETALALDLSRDKVRALEARALNKLRRHPNATLKEYVLTTAQSRSTTLDSTTTTAAWGNRSSSSAQQLEETFRNSRSDESSRPDRLWFF